MNVQDLWQQFGAAHPIYSHVLALLVGTIYGPKIIGWIESTGVDKVVAVALAWQKKAAVRAGASPEQVKELEKHQAIVLRRAADDVEKDSQAPAEPAAAVPAAAAAPAPDPQKPGGAS